MRSIARRSESIGVDRIGMIGARKFLFFWRHFTDGVLSADAATVRLDPGNEPQPDIALFIDPDCGGQTRLSPDDYIEGAPELLAEVSASTVSLDLGLKKTAYERNGVQEYVVWRVLEQAVDWFYLQDGRFVELLADADGITRSRVFPGLWLDRRALLQEDMRTVLAVLRSGLECQAHGAFLKRLMDHSGTID
jgi:hypothetical protein